MKELLKMLALLIVLVATGLICYEIGFNRTTAEARENAQIDVAAIQYGRGGYDWPSEDEEFTVGNHTVILFTCRSPVEMVKRVDEWEKSHPNLRMTSPWREAHALDSKGRLYVYGVYIDHEPVKK